MKNTPIDSKIAGQRNEQMIISMLRRHGQLSQTELCRLAGMGSSTASTIVARLREKGLVIETRGISDRRGPKPTILKLNPVYCQVIGVEINPSYLYVGLFNFLSELTDQCRVTLGTDRSVEHVVECLDDNISDLMGRNQLSDKDILHAGFTLSGSISRDGHVSLSSPMGWSNVPLRDKLDGIFNFPVTVYNNRVRLMAEFDEDSELSTRNILYLNLADGVGSTVYMDGHLVSGSTGRYGEIGHIVVDPKGPQCGCGHFGCLESFISGPALAHKIKNDIAAGYTTLLVHGFDTQQTWPVPEELLCEWTDAVEQGDIYAVELRDFVANYLAQAAGMLINCYDPEVIILAGYVALQFPDYFAQAIRDKLKTDVYDYSLRHVQIIPGKAGKDALIKGVAAAIFQDTLAVTK